MASCYFLVLITSSMLSTQREENERKMLKENQTERERERKEIEREKNRKKIRPRERQRESERRRERERERELHTSANYYHATITWVNTSTHHTSASNGHFG